MQALKKISLQASVVDHIFLKRLDVPTVDIISVRFFDLFIYAHFDKVFPTYITDKCTVIITMSNPVFLLPAVIARRAVYQLIKLCRIRDFVNTVRVLEFSVELLGSLTACDALGTKTINFLYGIKR